VHSEAYRPHGDDLHSGRMREAAASEQESESGPESNRHRRLASEHHKGNVPSMSMWHGHEHEHNADTPQLVKAVLLAAMYSEVSNARMIDVMGTLGTDVAMPIAQAIGELEELDAKLADMGADTETGSDMDHSTDSEGPATRITSYERDPELEREEKLIKALQEKRVLEDKIADLSDELKEARGKCSTLEEELAESKFTLDRRRRTTMDEQDLQQLNFQAGRDKDYIAELETDLANATSTIEQQERQMEKLKADDSSKQELKDELQFVKAERDELRQKSKVNENLKKKIQALQEHEKANTTLRKELQSVQEQLQEHETIKDRCTALEKANEENAQTIANGEQEIFDQKTAKKRMEHELNLVTQRFEQARDMLNSAQETIRDLEDRVQDGTSTRESLDDVENLDAELAAESGTENTELRRDKISRTPTSSAETIVLQQNLSIANAAVARLEQRCLDLLQENLGFKSDVDGAGELNTEHPFQHQTRRLDALKKELEEIQSKYIASTTEVTDLKRRLELSENLGMFVLPICQNTLTFPCSQYRKSRTIRRNSCTKPRQTSLRRRTCNPTSRTQKPLATCTAQPRITAEGSRKYTQLK
jgi:protein HOOK3